MYAIDTILTLKEPRSTDDKPFAYDRVRVVGPSPVDHGAKPGATWSGAGARGVIIQPVELFGANLDEPLGKIQALYDIESEPEVVLEVKQTVRKYDAHSSAAGKTPEEVFAEAAPGEASEDGKRVRTPISPLEDPRPAPDEGPLGKVESDEEPLPATPDRESVL